MFFLIVAIIAILANHPAFGETIMEAKTISGDEVKISAKKINNEGVIASLITVEIKIFAGGNSAKKKDAMEDTFFCVNGAETTIQKPEEKGEFIIYKFSFRTDFSLTTKEETSLIKALKDEIIDILSEGNLDEETTEKIFFKEKT